VLEIERRDGRKKPGKEGFIKCYKDFGGFDKTSWYDL
jgi:hypothetical protein